MDNKQIPGWFPDENRRILEKLIKDHNIKTVIEIGSFVGLSTVFFAERCERVIAIEPFNAIDNCDYLNDEMKEIAKNQREEYDKNTAGFKNIDTIPLTSLKASKIPYFPDADLIFIDGSHKYEDVDQDIKIWLAKARVVICGDDYSPWWPGVRQAVDENLPDANKENRVWYFIKEQ